MDALLFLKFLSVFVFVISLMLLLAWFLKKLGLPGSVIRGDDKRRLKAVEFLQVDPRHRLVLVRRDDQEHLIMMSPESQTVIETGIPAKTEEEHIVAFARDQRNVKI